MRASRPAPVKGLSVKLGRVIAVGSKVIPPKSEETVDTEGMVGRLAI